MNPPRHLALLGVVAAFAIVLPSARAVELPATRPADLRLVDVRNIWDRAPHNAFTDLVRFKGRWFCAFREGKGHVSPDGAMRVLTSADGNAWTSAALLTNPTADLRDPKLCVTPDGRLMMNGVAARPNDPRRRHQSMVWFSPDGSTWDAGTEVADPNVWLWRVTWHAGRAWGVGYSTDKNRAVRFARLYSSEDGARWTTAVETLTDQGAAGETALNFLPDDTALCLLRRDHGNAIAQLGTAKPPYTDWRWKELDRRIGGPALIRLPDGRLLAAVRLYDKQVRTALCWLDPAAGTLTEALTLPSGGDTSYAGMVLHDGLLWVSYYSSHEGKTSIYLARVAGAAPAAPTTAR